MPMVKASSKLMNSVRSTDVQPGHVVIWWIGQAGYIIKTSTGKVIFIDAYLSGGDVRMTQPPLEANEISCDLYICTHNHGDHADLETISGIIDKEHITFIGPGSVVKSLLELDVSRDNIRQLNVGDYLDLTDLSIRGTFCVPTDETVLDSTGLLLRTVDGVTLYHSGDTGFHDFLFYLSRYQIDVMMVCINGGFGNMGIDEAVRLTRYLRPKVVIPNHYGMFAHNTADPELFRTRLEGTRAEAPCKILEIGEKYVYPGSSSKKL